jgi:predicted SnoaL-like aldol condensation-catalyzing enzyme
MDLSSKIAANKAIIDSFNNDPTQPDILDCVAEHYYQHNLLVPDTKAGYANAIGAIAEQAKAAGFPLTAKVHRAFGDPENDEYTFFHVSYNFFGPKAGFDICRWEEGKIVEHWDNLADLSLLPEGFDSETLFSGATDSTDHHLTSSNKALVAKYTFNVLQCGRLDHIEHYVSEDIIQHVAYLDNGLDALKTYLTQIEQTGLHFYHSRHLIVGSGNFVLQTGQGLFDPLDTSSAQAGVWNLYRVENNQIVEHWEIREQLLEKEKHAHNNGKW